MSQGLSLLFITWFAPNNRFLHTANIIKYSIACAWSTWSAVLSQCSCCIQAWSCWWTSIWDQFTLNMQQLWRSYDEFWLMYTELLVLAEAVFPVVRAVVLNGWSPPGNLLEMQILESHPKLNTSETLGMWPSNRWFKVILMYAKFENPWVRTPNV